MQDEDATIEALREAAAGFKRIESLEKKLETANARLDVLEHALAPSLKNILTLRPLRFCLSERNRLKRLQKANARDAASGDSAPADFAPTIPPQKTEWPDFGVALFGHTRPDCIRNTLESLARQDAVHVCHVFLDGDQGRPDLRRKIDQVQDIVSAYPVKQIHRQRSGFGFRKMMLIAGEAMMNAYGRILFLEDDCFPVEGAVSDFVQELHAVENDDAVFSVYGCHFNVDGEADLFPRFQSWGWATTSKKLAPVWRDLKQCYLMSEPEYLEFVNARLTPEIRTRIDVTPGRQPSSTLTKFFAWDETVCLLTAARGLFHKRSDRRLIYNCGAGLESSHFKQLAQFRKPPFNMIGADEVWDYFQSKAGRSGAADAPA